MRRLTAHAPGISAARHTLEILAPTLLEYGAARLAVSHTRVSWTGVRLSRWTGASQDAIVVVCGLAGGVIPGLRSGTVLVPEQIGLPDGRIIQCDPTLVRALTAAAYARGFHPETGPLLTAPSLIVGNERYRWVQRGFVAADMETGLLAERYLRVATIRVILDSPDHGISPDWLLPSRAMLRPSLWRELFWLIHAAPRYSLRAARVLNYGLGAL